MKIYHAGTHGGKAHSRRDCLGLKLANTTVQTDISRMGPRELCKVCFPSWPTLNVLHRRCEKCSQKVRPFPCRHNGGVEVLVPTSRGHKRIHVWPEHAYKYRLAPTALPV